MVINQHFIFYLNYVVVDFSCFHVYYAEAFIIGLCSKHISDEQYLKDHPNIRISPTSNVSNGMLEILDLKKTDRAHFFSTIKNDYGEESTFKTLIRVKGEYI